MCADPRLHDRSRSWPPDCFAPQRTGGAMCKSTRLACAVLVFGTISSACSSDGDLNKVQLAANVLKSQLRGYDLGPPFPAGFRDSGLINGYGEGEWIPFGAIIS